MQTYIEHLKELALKDSSFSNPMPIDLKAMFVVLDAFGEELNYIKYKYFKDSSVNVEFEISRLKELYLFNPVIKHSYNVTNSEISVWSIKEECTKGKILSLKDLRFLSVSEMQDYAFYDGTPVKDVMEEIQSLKTKKTWWRHLFEAFKNKNS